MSVRIKYRVRPEYYHKRRARVEVIAVYSPGDLIDTCWESEPYDPADKAAADRALCAALRWLASDDSCAREVRERGFEVEGIR